MQAVSVEALYSLKPHLVWAFLKSQPASFWFINSYLFWEYVRPQSIYPVLVGPPWAFLSLVGAFLAVLLEGGSFRLRTPADAMLIAFSAVVFLSILLGIDPGNSFSKWQAYYNWVLIYLLITGIVTTERRFLVLMLAFMIYNFKMTQHGARTWAEAGFAFQGAGTSGAPGWFQNSGEFGVELAVFFPIVLYFTTSLRRHWSKLTVVFFWTIVVTTIMSVISTSSRGALIGLAGGVLYMVLKTRYKAKAFLGVAVLATFIALLLPPEFKERFNSIGEDKTSISRKNYWAFGRDVIRQYPVLGIGFGNWPEYYELSHGHKSLPHNLYYESTAELGYLGTMVLVGLIGASFEVNRRTRKLTRPLGERGKFMYSMANGFDAGLIGFLVSAQFVTVLYYPFFWINLAMTVSLHHAACDTLRELGRARAAPPPRAGRARASRLLVPLRPARGGSA